jgi:uncharacterized protein
MRPSDRLLACRERILVLAAQHGVSRVRVFGSVARRGDRADSDIDLVVDWPADRSLLQLVGLQLDIEAEMGVKVDLCTERELHPQLRDRILAQAQAL